MKTQIRTELKKSYRNHWVNAFFVLAYNESLTDEENIKGFFDWAYSISWEEVKKELDKRNIDYNKWNKW